MAPLDDFIRYENANSGLAFRELAYRLEDRRRLARDLLALANASVSGSRFLVVGVRDVIGGKREFRGLAEKAWIDVKRLAASVASVIEPALRVSTSSVRIDGALIGVLCLSECADPPYLLGARPGEGLMPGSGWVRRGTAIAPLLRADLIRMLGGKLASDDSPGAVRVGFGANLSEQLDLAILPLDELPSALAEAQLRALLKTKADVREAFGQAETRLIRLVHARYLGADTPYEPRSDDTLHAQLEALGSQYERADAYYQYEVRAHPLPIRISNGNGSALSGVTLTLKIPLLEGIGVATGRYPGPDMPPSQEDYPSVRRSEHAYRIQASIGEVPSGSTVDAFEHPPRLWVREAAAGKNISVAFSLQARELREPVRDVLLLRIAKDPRPRETGSTRTAAKLVSRRSDSRSSSRR